MEYQIVHRKHKLTEVRVRPDPATDELGIDFGDLQGVGYSKCSPNDIYSPTLGEALALGRALMHLGSQIVAAWNAKCVTRDEYIRAMEIVGLNTQRAEHP